MNPITHDRQFDNLSRMVALLDEFATFRDDESWPEDLEFEFGHLRLQSDEGRLA